MAILPPESGQGPDGYSGFRLPLLGCGRTLHEPNRLWGLLPSRPKLPLSFAFTKLQPKPA